MFAPHPISFSEVQKAIEDIFPNLTKLKWQLVPDQIQNLAQQAGADFEWDQIEAWSSFEYGHIEIPQKSFIRMLVADDCNHDDLMWLVTDEMFSEGKEQALELQVHQFPAFVESGYSERYNIAELFYPADVIIVFPERKEISMLHHSGFTTSYRKPDC